MANCLICGSEPTVKSHIVPRALFHDMRPEKGQLIGNLRDGPGYQHLQSGFWDKTILCAVHEGQLHQADEYGIRFCRNFNAGKKAGQWRVDVPNPDPALLVDFASACVWRMAASRSEGRPKSLLGPYNQRLVDSLFHGIAYRPMLLVACNAYHLKKGEILNFGALPFRYVELNIHFWRFIVGGLIFDLKLDARATPAAMATLAVNEQAEVALFDDFPQSAQRTPRVGHALAALSMQRRSFRPRSK